MNEPRFHQTSQKLTTKSPAAHSYSLTLLPMPKLTTYLFLVATLFLCALTGYTQLNVDDISDSRLDFGYSAKATVEFSNHPSIRLGAGAGIGRLTLNNWLYPTLNADLQLYYNGIGSARGSSETPKIYADFTLAPTITVGKLAEYQTDVFSPLLYFKDSHTTPLTNPFDLSVSMGSNIVYLSKREKKALIQRVGFVSTKIGESFQFYYYNDAGGLELWGNLIIADGYDRYHTGGAGVVISMDKENVVNDLGLHIQKFTGYGFGAFDTANQMQIDFVNSVDSTGVYFNNFKMYASGGNFETGSRMNVGLYNQNNIDFQHAIHFLGDYSYHYNPYKPHFFIEGGWETGSINLRP